MKINQYCSVCKKHLDMEVIPTDDGGDDGVIWLRCPECQGFLPKFTGEGLKSEKPAGPAETAPASPVSPPSTPPQAEPASPQDEPASPQDEPADVSALGLAAGTTTPIVDAEPATDAEDSKSGGKTDEPVAVEEPVAEYAALLADADTTNAQPYRPSSSYDVGDVILHLAYDDVGIVVSKEDLPGGRKAVKVFFDGAGVVHLIEQAADGH